MADKKGLLIICDRCGDTGFCECAGEGETDGGYTRWNKFEPPPEGWGWTQDCEKFHRLCPKCNEQFRKLIKDFEESPVMRIKEI
jgi:hypothetical protein